MSAAEHIAAAMGDIVREAEADRYRQQYRTAMKILREIPSGTPDSDLTPEQREAWKAHDDALRWLEESS